MLGDGGLCQGYSGGGIAGTGVRAGCECSLCSNASSCALGLGQG